MQLEDISVFKSKVCVRFHLYDNENKDNRKNYFFSISDYLQEEVILLLRTYYKKLSENPNFLGKVYLFQGMSRHC